MFNAAFILSLNFITVLAQNSQQRFAPETEGSGFRPPLAPSSIVNRNNYNNSNFAPGSAKFVPNIVDDEDLNGPNSRGSGYPPSPAHDGSGYEPPASRAKPLSGRPAARVPSTHDQKVPQRHPLPPIPAVVVTPYVRSSILSHTIAYPQRPTVRDQSVLKKLDIAEFTKARTLLPQSSVITMRPPPPPPPPFVPPAQNLSIAAASAATKSTATLRFRTSIQNVVLISRTTITTTPTSKGPTITTKSTLLKQPINGTFKSPGPMFVTPLTSAFTTLKSPTSSRKTGQPAVIVDDIVKDNALARNNNLIGSKDQVEKPSKFHIFTRPEILATAIGGVCIALLCAILLILFVIYRLRKKDEGSYALDETKRALSGHPQHHLMQQMHHGAGNNTYAIIPGGPNSSPYSRGGRGPPPIKGSLTNKEFYA